MIPKSTNEIPYLKIQCNRHHLPVPGPDPTPAQIIPHVQARLDELTKHPGQHCCPESADHHDWKLRRQDLTDFLTELRGYQSEIEAEKAAQKTPSKIAQPAENQPLKPDKKTDPGARTSSPQHDDRAYIYMSPEGEALELRRLNQLEKVLNELTAIRDKHATEPSSITNRRSSIVNLRLPPRPTRRSAPSNPNPSLL